MKTQILINLALIIGLLAWNKDSFLDYMWVFYSLHYGLLFIHIYQTIKKNYFSFLMLFSPILFSFVYLGISFTLGSVFIPLKYGWFTNIIEDFLVIKNLNIFTVYLFIVDVVLLWVWTFFVITRAGKIYEKDNLTWAPFNQTLFFLTFILFLLFNFSSFFQNLTFGFSYSFKLTLIIYLIIQSFSLSNKLRFIFYVSIIALIVPVHYHSKREIILVLFTMLFLEVMKNRYKIRFKFKHILLSLVAVFFAVYLVLAASIMRGYGTYDIENKFNAFLYVPDYIQQPYFKHAFVDNFELTPVLGSSMICMDLIQKGEIPLQFGGTYLKIFLAPIPRSIWTEKPYGMVLLYSYTYNPKYKETGSSYPVVHHVEGFANFYWLGIIATPLVMFFFERLYWYILNQKKITIFNGRLIISIYVVCTVFQYVRGIGFDTFMLYCLIPLPLVIFYSFLPKKKD